MSRGEARKSETFPVAAIVLAAGRSSRFEGGHKLLADVGGGPLIARVLNQVSSAPVRDIVLVVAADGTRVAAAAGAGRWRTVLNADAATGLSSSIRAGLAALEADVEGALVVLADMPGVSAQLIGRVIAAAACNPRAIIYPQRTGGHQGHPVYWPADLFSELKSISGDKGAKGILEHHKARLKQIDADAGDAFTDIDTRADLAAYLKGDNRKER